MTLVHRCEFSGKAQEHMLLGRVMNQPHTVISGCEHIELIRSREMWARRVGPKLACWKRFENNQRLRLSGSRAISNQNYSVQRRQRNQRSLGMVGCAIVTAVESFWLGHRGYAYAFETLRQSGYPEIGIVSSSAVCEHIFGCAVGS
jgi:hypothetical protein